MFPLISVIIPVYNVATFLNKCLQSVFEQTFKDWECILVDDGSTDDSPCICDSWVQEHSKFHLIHQSNSGVSSARNQGLRIAQGEFVVFIDSDDWIGPNYLSDLWENHLHYVNAELIVTGLIRQYQGDHHICVCPKQKQCIQLKSDCADVFVENISLFYGPTSKLYRLDIIRENSICFPVDFSLGEDLLFNFKYLECSSDVALLPVAHYYYNMQESGSLITTYRDNRFYVDLHLWETQYSFLQKKDMWNDRAREYMSLQLWGITYNGIFNKKNVSLPYLKDILRKVDTDILMIGVSSFTASKWIKTAIINKRYFLFYLVRKAMSLLKK